MFRRVLGPVCVFSLLTGSCGGGGATEPTRTTTSVRVSLVDPVAGTTLAKGAPFKISFTVERR